MKLGKFQSIWCFIKSPVLFTLLIVLQAEQCIGYRFGELIGIAFSAHGDNGQTLNDIKAKIKEVSKEYPRIFSFGQMARDDVYSYRWGETYNTSLPQAFTAEAAGQINHELKRAIRVIIGIYLPDDRNRFDVELGLALEAAKKSQHHDPKTTKGFVLDFSGTTVHPPTLITSVSRHARNKLKIDENDQEWTLGIRLSCSDFLDAHRGSPQDLAKMISVLNFIICEESPKIGLAGRKAFHDVGNKLFMLRMELQRIKADFKVTGQTGLPSRTNSNKEIDSLVNFWEAGDEWAIRHNFPLVMTEAFDDPRVNWDDSPSHKGSFGWWDVEKDGKGKYNVFKEKAPPKSSKGSKMGRDNCFAALISAILVGMMKGIGIGQVVVV